MVPSPSCQTKQSHPYLKIKGSTKSERAKVCGEAFWSQLWRYAWARFKRRTFHDPNLSRNKAEPNYLNRLN